MSPIDPETPSGRFLLVLALRGLFSTAETPLLVDFELLCCLSHNFLVEVTKEW